MIGVACRRSLSITVTHRPLDQVEHVAGIVDGNELRGRVERRCPTRPSVAPDTIAGWPKRIVTRPPGRSVSVASGSRSIGTAMKLADGFVREIRMHWLVTAVAPARCSRRCIRQSIKPSLHAACPATHRATLPLRRGSVCRRWCADARRSDRWPPDGRRIRTGYPTKRSRWQSRYSTTGIHRFTPAILSIHRPFTRAVSLRRA